MATNHEVAVDLHGHTAINISRSALRTGDGRFGDTPAAVGGSLPAAAAHALGDLLEGRPRQHCPFAPDVIRIDLENTVQLRSRWDGRWRPRGRCRCPRSPRRGCGSLFVVLAGQHQCPAGTAAVVADQQDRAVLALRIVLLIRHPGPHDFARIGGAVGCGGVADGPGARKSPAYPRARGRCPRRRRWAAAGRCGRCRAAASAGLAAGCRRGRCRADRMPSRRNSDRARMAADSVADGAGSDPVGKHADDSRLLKRACRDVTGLPSRRKGAADT